MSNIKLAVIGSCVSRDAFNSHFIKNYKEFYRCVVSQNHMSMISLMSEPIPFEPNKLEGNVTDFNKQILMTELTKGVWDALKIQEPDYLILDFYADVYFGIRKVGNSIMTDKTPLFQKTPFYETLPLGETLNIEDHYLEYMELWKKSVDAFMKKMELEFPYIKVIINKVHFTDLYFEKEAQELKKISESGIRKVDVAKINDTLNAFYEYFESTYNVDVIEYEKEYYSEENHLWELFYVHYTKDFYEDFTTKLLHIILVDLHETRMKERNSLSRESFNLLKNPTFNQGKSFWTYWHNDFKISQPEEDAPNASIVSICHNGSEKDLHRQIWSHAVEINTDGKQEYELTFDIKIKDIEDIDSLKSIFALRTFQKIDLIFQKDAQWFKNIKVWEIEGINNDEWTKCSFLIKPTKGKFMKIGPYLMRNGEVSWRNISLEKLY
ncbi:DUF6270 domain-containing protein [Niallia sp. FSL W8-0635]|uniref:DUF6270 domain-containing protein n=1 Tax=Niallia sp. FSL W8-0635 TaxID=2975337 RepID=UPI0030FA14ED